MNKDSGMELIDGVLTPVWRKDPPTVPGLYWFKLRTETDFPEGSTRYCRVILFNGSLIDARTHRGTENAPRWWAGPLLEPVDEWDREHERQPL